MQKRRRPPAIHYLTHHHINDIIGQRIIYFRQQKKQSSVDPFTGVRKWTQAWVGWQLGYSNQKVSNWETGHIGITAIDLRRLLDLFDISLDEFIGDAQLPSLYEMIKQIEDN